MEVARTAHTSTWLKAHTAWQWSHILTEFSDRETGAFAEGKHIRSRRIASGNLLLTLGNAIRVESSLETPPATTGRSYPSMVDHNSYTTAEAATLAQATLGRRSPRRPLDDIDEPSSEERATIRRAARMSFRTYCIACGRSSETPSAPPRLSRCAHCNGTMLIEPVTT